MQITSARRRTFSILGAAGLLLSVPVQAQEWARSDSPFVMGEAFPAVPADCETVNYWIDHAPQTEDRVSFAIQGELVQIEWDGALAYLIMCADTGVQVMCVTYSKEGLEVGDVVQFAGGYARVGERQIMLDPCLSSGEGV